jgi:hypothetical protein
MGSRWINHGYPLERKQADGETRSVVTASSIRRRSAAWTILLDWTYRSKRPAPAFVDDTGRIVREVKVASELEALLQVLGNPIYRFKRIGLEANINGHEVDQIDAPHITPTSATKKSSTRLRLMF